MKAILRRWGINREVVLLGFARMVDAFGASVLIILIPLFVVEHDIGLWGLSTSFVIGILLSTYGMINSLSQPSVGVWSDRVQSRKPFLIAGLVLFSLGTLAFIWVDSFVELFGLRILQGLAVALTLPPSMALMTEYTEPQHRGTAMSFYNIMRLVGFSIGPLVGGYLIHYTGFTLILVLGAGLGLVGSLLVKWLVQESKRPVRPGKREGILASYGRFLHPEMADFHKIAAANVSLALCISLIAPLENEFNQRLHQTAGEFGLAFSALIFTMMVTQLPIGRLADNVGRKVPIVTGLIVLAPATAWMGYVETTGHFVLARMIQGVCVAAVAAPSFALSADKSRGESRGREMSLVTMAFGLGVGLGPALSGLLAGNLGFSVPFWVGMVLALGASGLVAFGVEELPVADDLGMAELD